MAHLTSSNAQEGRPASVLSNSTRQWTPEHYTSSILAYANQKSASSLYVGVHFARIASLLRRPYETSRQSSTYIPTLSSDFATLYKLSTDGKRQIIQLTSPNELGQGGETESNGILFLRGQPCPEWLVHIGTTYRIDPEFFFRHLDFLSNLSSRSYFAHPSLISTSQNVIQFNYNTIGVFPSQNLQDQLHLDRLRHDVSQNMTVYFNELGKRIDRSESTAESIVRAYHVLDKKHFSIEQRVSICLQQLEKSWTVVVWLDTGKPLTGDQPSPWRKAIQENRRAAHKTFLPWVQPHPLASLHSHSLSISNERRPQEEVEQSASLLHLDYGKTLDKQMMAQHPFYALHELFMSFAFSEAQFLNVVESKINKDIAKELTADHNISPANMIYFQGLLDKHTETLQRNVMVIKSLGVSVWPRLSNAKVTSKTSSQAQSLLQDYEGLSERAKVLSNTCKARLQILMSRAGIVESNKAIEQAKVVTKLTRLAFVFIPLSFVCSFFGMNLTPFVKPAAYGLWIFFAVSAPMVLLLLLSMTWSVEQVVELFGTIWGRRNPDQPIELEDYD